MEWKNVASALTSDAPLLASLLTGPVGLGVTTSAALVSHAVATPSEPDAVMTALQQPESVQKVKQAEQNNASILQQLTATAAQAQMQHDADLARISASDTDSARHMQIATKDWVPKALAMMVTLGFFSTVVVLVFKPDASDSQLLNVVVGSLGTAWITIIGYYFGTSAGSDRKTELLAQPSVPIRSDSSVTLREPNGQKAPDAGPQGNPSTSNASAAPQLGPGSQGPAYELTN